MPLRFVVTYEDGLASQDNRMTVFRSSIQKTRFRFHKEAEVDSTGRTSAY